MEDLDPEPEDRQQRPTFQCGTCKAWVKPEECLRHGEICSKTPSPTPAAEENVRKRCNICKYEATTLEDFTEHLLSAHLSNVEVVQRRAVRNEAKASRAGGVCDICKSWRADLKYHVYLNHRRAKCVTCGVEFDNRYRLFAHKKRAHGNVASVVKRETVAAVSIKKEPTTDSTRTDADGASKPKRGFCESCQAVKEDLPQHMYTSHKDFKCDVCSVVIGNYYKLRKHKRIAHSGDDGDSGDVNGEEDLPPAPAPSVNDSALADEDPVRDESESTQQEKQSQKNKNAFDCDDCPDAENEKTGKTTGTPVKRERRDSESFGSKGASPKGGVCNVCPNNKVYYNLYKHTKSIKHMRAARVLADPTPVKVEPKPVEQEVKGQKKKRTDYCLQCNRTVKTKLKVHNYYKHRKGSFPCRHCPAVFDLYSDMVSHTRLHKAPKKAPEAADTRQEASNGQVFCQICSAYVDPKELYAHNRQHMEATNTTTTATDNGLGGLDYEIDGCDLAGDLPELDPSIFGSWETGEGGGLEVSSADLDNAFDEISMAAGGLAPSLEPAENVPDPLSGAEAGAVNHQNATAGGRADCPNCGKGFVNVYVMRRHLRNGICTGGVSGGELALQPVSHDDDVINEVTFNDM